MPNRHMGLGENFLYKCIIVILIAVRYLKKQKKLDVVPGHQYVEMITLLLAEELVELIH